MTFLDSNVSRHRNEKRKYKESQQDYHLRPKQDVARSSKQKQKGDESTDVVNQRNWQLKIDLVNLELMIYSRD